MPLKETEIISEKEIVDIAGVKTFEDIKKAKANLQSILNSLSSLFPLSEDDFLLFLKLIASTPDSDMGLNNLERLFAVIKQDRSGKRDPPSN